MSGISELPTALTSVIKLLFNRKKKRYEAKELLDAERPEWALAATNLFNDSVLTTLAVVLSSIPLFWVVGSSLIWILWLFILITLLITLVPLVFLACGLIRSMTAEQKKRTMRSGSDDEHTLEAQGINRYDILGLSEIIISDINTERPPKVNMPMLLGVLASFFIFMASLDRVAISQDLDLCSVQIESHEAVTEAQKAAAAHPLCLKVRKAGEAGEEKQSPYKITIGIGIYYWIALYLCCALATFLESFFGAFRLNNLLMFRRLRVYRISYTKSKVGDGENEVEPIRKNVWLVTDRTQPLPKVLHVRIINEGLVLHSEFCGDNSRKTPATGASQRSENTDTVS